MTVSINKLRVRNARQNNLKNIDIDIPLGGLTVLTGRSGSGKSSLAFDTIFAEGQRRYVETFSAYTRQFLDRMDKPAVDSVEGILPAVAIDQTNPVRTSRSTVGTMTEILDHLKLLYARAGRIHCASCGRLVTRDDPESIYRWLETEFAGAAIGSASGTGTTADNTSGTGVGASTQEQLRFVIVFHIQLPEGYPEQDARDALSAKGYQRVQTVGTGLLEVTQDRLVLAVRNRERFIGSLETAFETGRGRLELRRVNADAEVLDSWRYSRELHCADCDIAYRDATPNLFSFNSPIGACPVCRGFGRVIEIDYGLVVPDHGKSLRDGAVKAWETPSYRECRDELLSFAAEKGVRVDVPWRDLTAEERDWVIEGEGEWEDGVWYGIRRFFDWLESKSYKMHIRVLLSRYRAYNVCPECNGSRLVPEAHLWRLPISSYEDERGITIHELLSFPIGRAAELLGEFRDAVAEVQDDEAVRTVLDETLTRLSYLVEVGLEYLTLDRQSRTLSGGEVQRINLTTVLGTSLVNTLFVLDEPSIGLHSRDIARLIGILTRLRDAGNTLLVVEHEPEVILAADYILELGPEAGEHGGELIFSGTPAALLKDEGSPTGQALRARMSGGVVAAVSSDAASRASTPVQIAGAAEHNLKDIDVDIPTQRLVCVTGVSGSGKSTLVEEVLYRTGAAFFGRGGMSPGRHRSAAGFEQFSDIVLVDQSALGKTTRSNPASYVGAFDAIRKLFMATPEARERGYTAGTFSFNSGNGRCPRCGGNGFEHIEMQFLSDVYLTCPECDGKRFRPEILEISIAPRSNQSYSIADILQLTVSEACALFKGYAAVLKRLQPLLDVGLGYLRLGQPVPTLSGGEAQRLKLAGFLAESLAKKRGMKPVLFLFDEPTVGLHMLDVEVLITAFRSLLSAGHSVVVIEHNLDLVRACDHVIELGPEGGDAGGQLVVAGSPEDLAEGELGYTGRALAEYRSGIDLWHSDSAGHSGSDSVAARRGLLPSVGGSAEAAPGELFVELSGAREHNLQNIDARLPLGRFTVVTGVSGSGKSTVAFDILFAEGRRRYLESLNAYVRQLVQPASRPEIDALTGLPPTVAIEQRTTRGGYKSTVATVTELYHYLRLLFVRLGTQYCPDCNVPISSSSEEQILAEILAQYRGQRVSFAAPLVSNRKGYYTETARWAAAKGYEYLRVDGRLTSTADWPRLDRYKEHTIELPVGELLIDPRSESELGSLMSSALSFGKGMFRVYPAAPPAAPADGDNGPASPAHGDESAETGQVFSALRVCPSCSRSFDEPDPRQFSFNSAHGWCPSCQGTGLLTVREDEEEQPEAPENPDSWEPELCPDCEGTRLRTESRFVRFGGRSIAELTAYSVDRAELEFPSLLTGEREERVARDIIEELTARLRFLKRVGLGYLQLDRSAPTLSGGEAQRIRLAAALGSNLSGVCYVLDEPTIGLHPRDNRMLLGALRELSERGNTVVVVEHDEDTIRSAEWVLDLGPGGGREGGKVVYCGPAEGFLQCKDSATARHLSAPPGPVLEPASVAEPALEPYGEPARVLAVHDAAPAYSAGELVVRGASLHNLRDLTVSFPLGQLICVTGVSGSGKSSLVRGVLYESLKRLGVGAAGMKAPQAKAKARAKRATFGCEALEGTQHIERVAEVDQSPIGRTPRSCPATYVGIWDDVRKLYATLPESTIRGYDAGRFSFNTKGGRCEHCAGQGEIKIEMSFLPDVSETCGECGGKRFTEETREVRFKGRSIADILEMSVAEATEFFAAHPKIQRPLKLMNDIGLGYLHLGRQSPTLSGGEAQRIKLVSELSRGRNSLGGRSTLFILDEPTVGLHMSDVGLLTAALKALVVSGNTVVVIEHNLDLIAAADHVIDLGPDAGTEGGNVVAEGRPDEMIRGTGHTATALREHYAQHKQHT